MLRRSWRWLRLWGGGGGGGGGAGTSAGGGGGPGHPHSRGHCWAVAAWGRGAREPSPQRPAVRVPRPARESCDIVRLSLRIPAASASYHLAEPGNFADGAQQFAVRLS